MPPFLFRHPGTPVCLGTMALLPLCGFCSLPSLPSIYLACSLAVAKSGTQPWRQLVSTLSKWSWRLTMHESWPSLLPTKHSLPPASCLCQRHSNRPWLTHRKRNGRGGMSAGNCCTHGEWHLATSWTPSWPHSRWIALGILHQAYSRWLHRPVKGLSGCPGVLSAAWVGVC